MTTTPEIIGTLIDTFLEAEKNAIAALTAHNKARIELELAKENLTQVVWYPDDTYIEHCGLVVKIPAEGGKNIEVIRIDTTDAIATDLAEQIATNLIDK